MLTDVLKGEFEPAVRRRGEAYAAAGNVHGLSIRKSYLAAEVQGSALYDVTIHLEPGADRWNLLALCDCAYAETAPCKHIWATLIKAQDRIPAKWGPPPPRILFFFDESEFDATLDEADDEDDWNEWDDCEDSSDSLLLGARSSGGQALLPPPGRSSSAPQRPARSRRPEWEHLLNSAPPPPYAGASKPHAPIGPLRYILDVERSRKNGVLTLALAQDAEREKKSKRIAINAGAVSLLTDTKDQAICAMIVGAAQPVGERSYFYSARSSWNGSRSSLWQLDHALFPVVLPMLFDTGRFWWSPDDRTLPRPLAAGSEPWELALVVEHEEQGAADRPPARGAAANGARRVLRAALVRSDGSVPLDDFDIVFEGRPAYALRRDTLAPIRSDARPGSLAWLRGQPPVAVSPADALPLLRSLNEHGLRIPVRLPPEWAVRERDDVAPLPRLSVQPLKNRNSSGAMLEAKLSFGYGAEVVAGSDGGQYVEAPAHGEDAEATLIRRRPEEEYAALSRLVDLGARPDPFELGRSTLAASKLNKIVTTLLAEGWEVRGESGLFRPAGKVNVRVSTGIDWFDVEGEADFGADGATASIAQVLAALKRGERFVALGDGSQGMMPEQWLNRHAGWMRLGEANGDGVRFSRAQLSVIDAMLAEMPEATCDRQLAAARRKLARFEGVRPATEPRGFRGELRPYQRLGLGWLRFLDEFGFGGCLADDMGLGKTVQVLALLADRARPRARGDAGPWLLVAPRSVVFNWIEETGRFAPSLRIVDYTGPDRGGADDGFADADVVITTFGTLRKDIEQLREIDFAGVVLDEAQAIKNPASQSAKAARLLRARQRLALTGTPIENSLDDLWSIFEFLNPGMLGSAEAFAQITRCARASGESADLAPLRRALRPFVLRRTKKVVAPELPERTEQTVQCDLVGRQKTLYESLRKHYRDQLLGRIDREGMNKSRMHVLEALLRLRQVACHPRLIEPNARRSSSGKLQTLLDMVSEIASEGNKALVFSQFTSLLDLVQHEVDARGIACERLDGKTPARERKRRVDRFQADSACPLFLISLKAGGVGLNLTAAQYVFLLDPWWNPAVEAQAIDRTHRIGQDRHISAYRLIAKETVEERILELQASKRELADAIVGEQKGGLKALTREDLEWLLG